MYNPKNSDETNEILEDIKENPEEYGIEIWLTIK